MDGINRLLADIDAARQQVITHPIYPAVATVPAARTFMEHHVWAVWDFMSLLKQLQRSLTCTVVPWLPVGDPTTRRLINEIAIGEECDELPDGTHASHFELYLTAMREAEANTRSIDAFTRLIRQGQTVHEAMKLAHAPEPATQFVMRTFAIIAGAPLHAQAAAFALGREDLIPPMFDQMRDIGLPTFADYLRRHCELDANAHQPLAMRMVAELCGGDRRKWKDCEDAARFAYDARRVLWDDTLAAIGDDAQARATATATAVGVGGDPLVS
jgi:hypothetical protein